MPSKKWDTHDEVKLLLAVIGITNPKVPGSAWAGVAAIMGPNFTAEAVRQKFNLIKRGSKAAGTDASLGDASKSTTATKPKDTPTKSRKRKAPTPPVAEDDDEEPPRLPPTKRSRKTKIKTEDTKFGEAMSPATNNLRTELFKAEEDEDGEWGVDLEHDDLYDA